ncbi:MAG: ATP-binding protein [Gammaproteobacteria bacterium]
MIFPRKNNPKRRIAIKLIYYVILASAFVTLIITGLQLYRDYSNDVHEINHRFIQIKHVYLQPLSHAMWTTDKQEMQLQIDGMRHLPDIQYIAVFGEDGLQVSAGKLANNNTIKQSFELTYEYRGALRHIGRVEIVATLSDVYKRLFNRIWIILVSNFFKTLIIAGFFMYIFQSLVTRHINHMADQVREMDAENLDKPITLERTTNRKGEDEFDVLINAFDDMRARIAEGFEKIKRREQELMLYEMIMATTQDQMSYIDRDYIYRAVNTAYTKTTGVSREKIIGHSVQDLMGRDFFFNVSKPNLDKVFEGRQITSMISVIDKDGNVMDMEVNYYPYYGDSDVVQGAVTNARDVTARLRIEQERMRNAQIYATLAQQGAIKYQDFLYSCLSLLKKVFNSRYAVIGRQIADKPQIQTECVLDGDKRLENFIYDLEGTPCDKAFSGEEVFYYRDVSKIFPKDKILKEIGAQSYFGISLSDTAGKSHGILAVIDTKPHEPEDWHADIIGVFAARIAVEMERAEVQNKLERYNEELEEQVAVRTCELENSLKELETFSYSVSHDLRGPLRAINGYSQILADEYAERLDETGIRYLSKIRYSSEKMSMLIDNLLRLSRISRQNMEMEYINLSRICDAIFKNNFEVERHAKFYLKIEADIFAYCDAKLMRIALENLIDNAVKYSADASSPQIEIGVSHVSGVDAIYIKDNGVGFDQKFTDVIFQPFQRLHGDEFSGTGIGLATVQRIINRHGGRIWAESSPGQGACFYFFLPGIYYEQRQLYSN